ncbi:carbamoyl phosphate synthase small subunit [Candidatus Woesearchaeota archaeon]|nr:carbamoyl phosphate synthase small subunit [Candidatus Woesearchaeota archaeon]|tara:strand:- start:649 stop:1848 length:1200 start_codon:yes stop_codon:yes gene_type:complete
MLLKKNAKLVLEDGSIFYGYSFAASKSISGEVVFSTGMVGYPESLTDPSYKGQILCLTYPLIGNYGVPSNETDKHGLPKYFESYKIHIQGLVISDYSFNYSHWNAKKSLAEWLKEYNIPGIFGVDTRELTKKLRESGTMLGKIIINDKDVRFYDPNKEDLVKKVTTKKPILYDSIKKLKKSISTKIKDFRDTKNPKDFLVDNNSIIKKINKIKAKKIVLIDCGVKYNIIRCLLKRNLTVILVPYDYDFFKFDFDGILISNGPGDPKICEKTIKNIKKAIDKEIPIFGICLGNQILALAAGADTYKLKYGHRSQNQPCVMEGTKRCFITTQNHGFAVDTESLPKGWEPWFTNANDGTNEGIRHKTKPFMSEQFHSEATPGPVDTEFLFDEFVEMIKKWKR